MATANRPDAQLAQRIEALRRSPAYRHYLDARGHVLRMKQLEADRMGAPSAYWEEELANFEYMLDASPLVVEKLRHHTFHVTGLRVYDYRTKKDTRAQQYREKLDALIDDAGGRDLLVPESPALGGFGFNFDGELYNLDTLKFFESLIALERGAVLGHFRDSPARSLVWEIGAGWGGFAYQFRSLFPNVTYVIVDLPELLLFSAVYLRTLFPEANVRFYGEEGTDDPLEGWEGLDFIFIPHTRLDAFAPPRLDLTVNTVSFQEMTTGQVANYVEHAYRHGCPYIYSLNRDRSLYNEELSSVREIIGRRYWPHEVEVLPVSYTTMLNPAARRSRAARAKRRSLELSGKLPAPSSKGEDLDYKHVIGWRRVYV